LFLSIRVSRKEEGGYDINEKKGVRSKTRAPLKASRQFEALRLKGGGNKKSFK